jgi:hypothetical protein
MKYLLLAPSGAQPAPAARAARWTAGAATWHTTRRCIAVTERLPVRGVLALGAWR